MDTTYEMEKRGYFYTRNIRLPHIQKRLSHTGAISVDGLIKINNHTSVRGNIRDKKEKSPCTSLPLLTREKGKGLHGYRKGSSRLGQQVPPGCIDTRSDGWLSLWVPRSDGLETTLTAAGSGQGDEKEKGALQQDKDSTENELRRKFRSAANNVKRAIVSLNTFTSVASERKQQHSVFSGQCDTTGKATNDNNTNAHSHEGTMGQQPNPEIGKRDQMNSATANSKERLILPKIRMSTNAYHSDCRSNEKFAYGNYSNSTPISYRGCTITDKVCPHIGGRRRSRITIRNEAGMWELYKPHGGATNNSVASSSKNAVRINISSHEPLHPSRRLDADGGETLSSSARRHPTHGMVYNRNGKAFHPPFPRGYKHLQHYEHNSAMKTAVRTVVAVTRMASLVQERRTKSKKTSGV